MESLDSITWNAAVFVTSSESSLESSLLLSAFFIAKKPRSKGIYTEHLEHRENETILWLPRNRMSQGREL